MLSTEKERSDTADSISFEKDKQRRAAILTALKILAEPKRKHSLNVEYISIILILNKY